MDGGKTWELLDSSNNPDPTAPGAVSFALTTGYQVIVDPTAAPDGDVIAYMALSGNSVNAGIWRSVDSGETWTRLLIAEGTSVALAAGSAGANGNLQILYAGVAGVGVYYTTSAVTTASMTLQGGNQGVQIREAIDNSDKTVPVNNDALNPGSGSTVTLATPALTGNPLEDTLYEGWVYAAVANVTNVAGNTNSGLYVSKDFGLNWTEVDLFETQNYLGEIIPTNNNKSGKQDNVFFEGTLHIFVDPNNANVVYVSSGIFGSIRVDITNLQDPYMDVAFDNELNDGGLVESATTGGVSLNNVANSYGLVDPVTETDLGDYENILRDPNSPFEIPATLQFTNVSDFSNTGYGASWEFFNGGVSEAGTQYAFDVVPDPLTGQVRLIFGDNNGVWTGTDNGSGQSDPGIGTDTDIIGGRNGDLAIAELTAGAVQPSVLASDLAGALLYANTNPAYGYSQSDPNVLTDGNLTWVGPASTDGDVVTGFGGLGIATDQTGSGAEYQYNFPFAGASPLPADFFMYTAAGATTISRTTGLLQPGDNPSSGVGQWPVLSYGYNDSNFAVNPIDPTGIVIASADGRLFLTSGPSLGTGIQWFPIANPTDLDSSQVGALAFGAPASATAPLDNFIYAGTAAGDIFVTLTGGGAGTKWTEVVKGLGAIEQIIPDPTRGTYDAYFVTQTGVYYLSGVNTTTPTVTNVTGNLFSPTLTRPIFNDPAQQDNTLVAQSLTSLQVDWRYAIPDNLAAPVAGQNHPVLYVAGTGGVFRSLDNGTTWTYFPDQSIDGAVQEGGLLPTTRVASLNLSLGDINPNNGMPSQPYGNNMLVATTDGRSVYVIRLNDNIIVPGGNALYTYSVSPVDGPHVTGISGVPDADGTSMDGIQVTFSGPVDPSTFSASKVNFVTGPDGPDGLPVQVSSVIDLGATNHNVYEIVFANPAPELGFYTVSLGPNISDYSGNEMDQNQNFINGENPGDIYLGRFLWQPFTNNAPVITGTNADFLPSVDENQAAATITGTTVDSFVISMAPASISDPDEATYESTFPPSTAPVGIAITAVDDTNGMWQYSQDNGTTWNNISGVSDTSALLLEADSDGIASSDALRFVPNINFSGPATFTFRAWDLTSGLSPTGADGGTADTSVNGGSTAFSATTATATITVNFVNKAPSGASNTVTTPEDTAYKFKAADFGFSDPNVPAQTFKAVEVTTLPAAGKLTDNGVAVSAGQFIPIADINAGKFVFTPTTTDYGSPFTSFTFQVQNSGGTANSGVDTDPIPKTMTIDVTFVNHAPTGANNTVATAENNPYTFQVSDFGFSDPNDNPANNFLAVEITTLPALGSLTDNGVAVTAGQFVQVTDVSAGDLVYTPVANASGTPYTSFTFQVQDDGGTANGGHDTDPSPKTMTIDVGFVNKAPSGANNTVTTLEDTAYTFKVGDFGFSDPNTPPQSLKAVEITTLPGAGSLTDKGVAVTAGQFVAVADITGGKLVFTPPTTDYGSPFTSFTFQVQNNGGTADGGVDTDPTPKTMTVNVTFVNHAPVGTSNTVTTLENTAYTFKVADFGFSDPNDNPANSLKAVEITTLPATGALADNGVAVTAKQFVPVADITGGKLVFTPVSKGWGSPYTSFTFQVQDNGGTANGGVDTDPTPRTMTIDVSEVNHAPTGANNTVTTLENTAYTFKVADFGFSDPNDNPANNLKAVEISTLPATGSLADSGTPVTAGQFVPVADISGGKLVFTPVSKGWGSPYTSFTFQVQDNGGTANGGVDTDPTPRTMTIDVSEVNHAPTGANNTVTTLENKAYTFKVADFGFSDPNDNPANNLKAVEITTLPTAGSLADNGVALTAKQFVPVADISGGKLVFTPVAGASGSPYTTFTFQVQDDGGTANGGVDTDPTPRTMTVNVSFVNHAPTGANKTVTTNENTAYTFAVADFGFSDPNVPPQTLKAVEVTTLPATGSLTDNSIAVAAGQFVPVADISGGKLVFTPVSKAWGSPYASFTFQVQNNGGTANGGVDTDPTPKTMTIDVSQVNHAPTGANNTVTTNENTAYTFAVADFGFSDPNDNPANTLKAVEITTLPATGSLADNGTTVTATQFVPVADISGGKLVFTPATHTYGTPYTSFTFQVQDNGGTANGGVDTDPTPKTMTLDVTQTEGDLTSITFSPNPTTIATTYGKSVTLTAKVLDTSSSKTVVNLGTVTFVDTSNGNATVGTPVTLTSALAGVATISTTALTGGTHIIAADYSGSGLAFASSNTTTSATVTVAKLGTTTTITKLSSASATYGTTVTFLVTVAGTATASAKPTGTVTITDTVGGTVTTLYSGAALSASQYSFSSAALAAPLATGVNSIKVTYNGDINYSSGSTATTTVTVTKVATTTTLTSSSDPAVVGTSITFTAAVKPPAGGTPTGTVDFYKGTVLLGTGKLAVVAGQDVATYATSTLADGSYSITAKYLGDADFNTSTSAAVKQLVGNKPVALVASVPAVQVGTSFALTIHAVDAKGVATVAYSGPVTVTFVSGPGVLTGTLTGTMTNGVLVLSGLNVSAASTAAIPDYTVSISSGTLPTLNFQFAATAKKSRSS